MAADAARDARATWPLDVPFDQYQRYRIAAEIAAAVNAPPRPHAGRVLDVGGHHQGPHGEHGRPIRDFLPHWRSVSVDLGHYPLTGYVEASGDQLPFADRSFDVVTCLDVLEHVPVARRTALVSELCRVSDGVVVLAAPFADARVDAAERLLADFIQHAMRITQAQLAEHRDLGWPDLAATMDVFRAESWAVETFAHGNLWRWLFMMLDKHAVQALPHAADVHARLDAAYNEVEFEADSAPPWYRHFIVAWRSADHPARTTVARRFSPNASPLPACPSPVVTPDDRAMLALAAAHARNQEIVAAMEPARRDVQLAAAEAHREDMYRHLHAKDAYIAKLEGLLEEVRRSVSYRVGRAIRTVLPGSGGE